MNFQFKVEVNHAGSMVVNFADELYIEVRSKEELWYVLQTLASPSYGDGFKYLQNHFSVPETLRRDDEKAILHAWLLSNTVTRSKGSKKEKPPEGFTLENLGLGRK